MGRFDLPPEAPEVTPPPAAAWCQRCGLTLNEAEIRHNLSLVLARCCPRCDGPLKVRVPPADAAIYLG
jgi:Zn finger protein HypA/HybF involved in hydrogenase expression